MNTGLESWSWYRVLSPFLINVLQLSRGTLGYIGHTPRTPHHLRINPWNKWRYTEPTLGLAYEPLQPLWTHCQSTLIPTVTVRTHTNFFNEEALDRLTVSGCVAQHSNYTKMVSTKNSQSSHLDSPIKEIWPTVIAHNQSSPLPHIFLLFSFLFISCSFA